MIKKIKKVLFFLFFLSTSIFPMQQVATALLARRVLIQSALIEQKRSFHSTPCLRSSLNDYFVDLTIEQVTDSQGEAAAKVKCSDVPPANNSSNNIAAFLADNKSINSSQRIILMSDKETWNNNPTLEHATDRCQKDQINKSCAGEMVSKLSQQVAKAALIAKNKMHQRAELSHCVARYQQNVENIKKGYVFSFSSLSRYEMFERKEELVRRLAQYEAQEDLLFRENAKVYYAIGPNDYCIDSCNVNQQEWTLSDFNDAFIALDIKAEIEALRFSIQECDKSLNKELYDLEHALKDVPLSVVKDKELDLIKQTKSFDDAISKVTNELKIIKNDLDVSNLQKNAFNQRSIAERFKGLFTGAHRQEFLLDEKIRKCQESVRDKEHELLILRAEKSACTQQIEYAKKISAKKEIELQQQRENEIKKQTALESVEINQQALLEQTLFEQAASKQADIHYQQQHEQASLEQVSCEIRDYMLDAQTESFLVEHGMQISDYTQIMGNLLQHNLHSELCSQLRKAARIAGSIHHQNDLLHQAVLFADAGVASNKAELYNLTLSLLDASDGLIGFVQTMSKETNRLLYVAGKQAIETVMDLPATTVHGIIDIYRFLEMVKEQVIPPNSLSSFEFNNVQSCSKIGDTFAYRKEFIINSLSHLSQASLDWIAHRSAHDKAEDIVKFVTDAAVNVIAFEAVIAKVGQACRFLTQGMGHARALELAENLLIHEQEIVPALETGVGNFENLVLGDASEKLIHAFESDMEVVMSPCGKRIEKVRAKPAKQGCSVDQEVNKKALELAETHFKIKPEIIEEVKAFADKYRIIEVEIDGIIQKVEVDWEHILLPGISKNTNYNKITKISELTNIKISGWHHGLWKEFEEKGLIKIIDKVERNGHAYLKIEWPFGNKNKNPIVKTFYSDVLDYNGIKDTLAEAIKLGVKHEKSSELNLLIDGCTRDGLNIDIKLSRKSIADKWRLDTAFIKKEYFGKQ